MNLFTKIAVRQRRSTDRAESGQASILLLSILGTFLLASVAFAVDMGSLWFHRQAAQAAADAACGAGAMDMLYKSQGSSLPSMNFTPGTAGKCSAGTGGAICSYAGFNGYAATSGGMVTTAASKDTLFSFPVATTVPGVTGASSLTYPLLKVTVEENVKTWFMGLLGKKFQVVAASCTCGMTGTTTPPPLVVLDPTGSQSLNLNNSGDVVIAGGPQLGVQVNSSSLTAIYFATSSDQLDTSNGGPGAAYNGNGSNVGVFSAEADPGTTNFVRGTTGLWVPNSPRAANPFAAVSGPVPSKMATSATSGGPLTVAYNVDGCPDSSGCVEFKPGVYAGGITTSYWQTMIFVAGVYYMNGSIEVNSEIRLARPSGWLQTDGVMFYFLNGSLHVTNGSGNISRDSSIASTSLTCDGSDPDPTHTVIPASLSGNILVGPCTANGTYWDANGDTSDTAGTTTAPGTRGLIVFHDPTNTFTPSSGNLDGGAALTFAGSLYYHSTGYTTLFSINNAGTSGGLALGQVIADRVQVAGSGALKMLLLSSSSGGSTKVGVFQ